MADAWYLFDGARQLGPFSLVELRRLLEIQTSPTRVWRDGLADWTAPADLPELTPARPPPLPPDAFDDPKAGIPTGPSRSNNFIARNWRGEFSLATSYWLFVFLGNLIAGTVAIPIIDALQASEGYQPLAIFAGILLVWLAIGSVAIWQLVGVWRSANRYVETRVRLGKKSPWARLAQVAVIIGALRLAGTFLTSGGPQLVEAGRMSFLDDPDIPAYSIRVMRNGTEAEIAGGFKYGLTNDFSKILDASRQIKVIHLDSLGGRIGEAISLNKVIRDRGLDTYVSSNCMSACTIAFAGGAHRILRIGAALGFHAPAFPGMTEGELAGASTEQKEIFHASGFDDKFVDRALSTPNATIWEPTVAELLQARVITATSDGGDFAISGLGAPPSKSDFEALLSKALPLMEPLKRRFPEDYDSVVQAYFDSYESGETEAEYRMAGHGALLAILKRLRPLADDDVLADFVAMLADQYDALGLKSAVQCYQYASGLDDTIVAPDFSEALVARENDVDKRVIETATDRAAASTASISAAWKKIGVALTTKGIKNDQFGLLAANSVSPDKYGDYCAVAAIVFREISKLPRNEAGMLIRDILAEKN